MKTKYILSSIATTFVLGFASCGLDYEPVSDYSDITEGVPDTPVAGAVFKDKEAVDSYMKELNENRYKNNGQEHWFMDILLTAEVHADNAYAGTTGAECLPYENNSIEGSNSVIERDWTRHLANVGYANVLINNIDKVEDPALTQDLKNRYIAQAKIFRAMVWFDMVRMWGDIPVITTIADDITEDNIEEIYPAYFPTQTPEIDVYRQIETDLLDAIKYAPATDAANKNQMSIDVAYCLLAKIYAEKPIRDYEKVIQYADLLAADGYRLNENYSDCFALDDPSIPSTKPNNATDLAKRNTPEVIYEGHFSPSSGNWCTWMFGRNLLNWDENFTWAKWVTPSRDLIKAYDAAGDVVRKNESIVFMPCTWDNYYPRDNYAFMFKVRSNASSLIKFRYADILLLKAEAMLYGRGDLESAAQIIDQVRDRAGLNQLPKDVRSSREAMEKAYLNERRLELAFEGQRWFDLVRLNKVEEVMNAVYAKDSGRKTQVYPFNANSYRMPLPQSELDANENYHQNAGY